MLEPTIGLFPLQLVVLPQEPLPLHIFEERYKQLIHHCVKDQKTGGPGEFGIIHSEADGLSAVGTILKVSEILEVSDDGRMNLVAMGQRRFTIKRRFQEHLYDSAEIEAYEDDDGDWDEELATQAFGLHRYLIKISTDNTPTPEAYSGLEQLSFCLAGTSAMDPSTKQLLLEMQTENGRLDLVCDHLKSLIPQLEALEAVKRELREKWSLMEEM